MANLPQRYRPFLAQARTEGALRYGAQESALGQLRSQAVHDYAQGLMAQTTATQGLLGSLTLAPQQITNGYASVGLTSPLLASLAQSGSPSAQRIAGEQASALAGIVQQKVGAQAGQVAGVNRLTDQYNQDAGQIGSQSTALEREKGLFEQDLVDQLITGDRTQRAAAKAEFAKEQFTARQNTRSQDAATLRTEVSGILSQGLTPVVNKDGTVTIGGPIPGGRADPNSPLNRPKVAPPAKPTGADRTLNSDINKARAWIHQLDAQAAKGAPAVRPTPGVPGSGHPAIPPITDPKARRAYVKEILSVGNQQSGIPSITSPGLAAALDMYYDHQISGHTVSLIHNYGAKVKFADGVTTHRPPPPPKPPQPRPVGVFAPGSVRAPTIG